MTENEIMKALEICSKNTGVCDCACPLIDDEWCQRTLAKAVQYLINSKNAEIDRLEQNLKEAFIDIKEHLVEIVRLTEIEEAHRSQNGELRKEVERLTINMNAFGLGMKRESERADTARAEAIKEFVEKIYRSCAMYGQKDKFNKTVFLNIFDQIAKEMGVE